MPSPVDRSADPELSDCAFCRRIMVGHFIVESEMAVVFRDAYRVTPGHVHIVPRRHEPDFFDLSGLERDSMLDLIDDVRDWLEAEFGPDGYNIGLNIGAAAGQTIPHAHLHVIPRYEGEAEHPRGMRSVLGGAGADYNSQTKAGECGFCADIKASRLRIDDGGVVVIDDAYPLAPGHCHVAPRRHEPDFFALDVTERDRIWSLVERVRTELDDEHQPDGYNIGFNRGAAAGQSVPHAHLHVIPRWFGDVDDPRGGLRWVRPERAPYWTGQVIDEPARRIRTERGR